MAGIMPARCGGRAQVRSTAAGFGSVLMCALPIFPASPGHDGSPPSKPIPIRAGRILSIEDNADANETLKPVPLFIAPGWL